MVFFFNAGVYMCIYVLVLIHNVPYREIKYNHEQGLFFFGNKALSFKQWHCLIIRCCISQIIKNLCWLNQGNWSIAYLDFSLNKIYVTGLWTETTSLNIVIQIERKLTLSCFFSHLSWNCNISSFSIKYKQCIFYCKVSWDNEPDEKSVLIFIDKKQMGLLIDL